MAIIVHSPSGGSHEGTWLLGYIMSWSTGEAGHTKHLKDNAFCKDDSVTTEGSSIVSARPMTAYLFGTARSTQGFIGGAQSFWPNKKEA
eukprot:1144962-Pelagomonas_calceolata.AAC.9